MFEIDPKLTWVKTSPEEVFDIYTSINRSSVAVPGRAPEPTQAYIATIYRPKGYEVCIYLYLANSNEGLLYRWTEGPVAGEEVPNLFQAALEFTEQMGFMMDDMHYRTKAGPDKAQTFSEVPMFHSDLSFMKPDGEGDELVIESLEEEGAKEAEEAPAAEAEEVDLDLLGKSEDVSPQPPKGKIKQAPPPEDDDIEVSIDDSEVMLDKSGAAEVEEISLDDSLGEETIEGAPPPEAVMEKDPGPAPAETGERALQIEEETTVEEISLDETSAEEPAQPSPPPKPLARAPEIKPKAKPSPPPAPMAKPAPAPEPEAEPEPVTEPEAEPEPEPQKPEEPAAAASAAVPANSEDDDFLILVKFLAMM